MRQHPKNCSNYLLAKLSPMSFYGFRRFCVSSTLADTARNSSRLSSSYVYLHYREPFTTMYLISLHNQRLLLQVESKLGTHFCRSFRRNAALMRCTHHEGRMENSRQRLAIPNFPGISQLVSCGANAHQTRFENSLVGLPQGVRRLLQRESLRNDRPSCSKTDGT